MRYFIEFAYKGTYYHGSQIQPNGITVQGVLQGAFQTIMRQPVSLIFAGRTDAGVHALQMFAHFDIDTTPPSPERLNRLLPEDIAVYRIFPVAADMHARFSAVSRTYEYRITTTKSPFTSHVRTYISGSLDYTAMNEAAQLLLGTHDFATFCKAHTDSKTTICTVSEAEWKKDGDGAIFTITANRFLRNMVRAVVGTLFEVGRHRITLEDFEEVIASLSRQSAGQSVPPDGLFLTHVRY